MDILVLGSLWTKQPYVLWSAPHVHHHIYTETTPLDVNKQVLCLTSLVIFFLIFNGNHLWKKLYEMKLNYIHEGIFVGES